MDQAHPGATNRKARRVQQGRAFHSVSGRPDQSEHSAQWRQPPTVRYGEDQSGASWHPQVSFQEPLSYGHSPSSFSSGSTSSGEQSTLGEPLQEFLPQNSFIPHLLQNNSFTSAYIWPQTDGDNVSHSFVDQTVVPYLAGAAPPILKRKRELESPTQVLLPYFHREWYPVPQTSSPQYGGAGAVLCSRCNMYESLFGVPGFCSSCLQVSFNTQPSAVGIRNENLESLVLFLIPAHMEDVLSSAPPNMPRSRSWRMLPPKNEIIKYDSREEGFHYRWNYLKRLVMSTQLFSDDFAQLANIAQMYQVSIPTKSKSLETCCTALISVCELYNTVIGVPTTIGRTPQIISIPKLVSHVRATRITVRHAFQQYEKLAAAPSDSRDRQDWIPAFLSASILTVAAIFFLDIMVACPSPYKEQIWGEAWNERILEMRNGGYGMLISLLRVNSGGINPMKMDCWVDKSPSVSPPFDPFINATVKSYSPDHQPPPKKRSKSNSKVSATNTNANTSPHMPASISSAMPNLQHERNILLGRSSPAALQGMLALQEWNQKYGDILEQGKDVFKQPAFRLATTSPLAGLWRIFELQ